MPTASMLSSLCRFNAAAIEVQKKNATRAIDGRPIFSRPSYAMPHSFAEDQ
jgi:hypothetical protein